MAIRFPEPDHNAELSRLIAAIARDREFTGRQRKPQPQKEAFVMPTAAQQEVSRVTFLVTTIACVVALICAVVFIAYKVFL